MSNHREFIYWAFQSMVLAVGAFGVSILSDMNKSIQELNIKVAVVIQKVEINEKRIDTLENRRK